MAVYWIDVEDASGAKLGDGPITSATDWTHTSNLDRAGAFAFTMPKDDPRAVHVQAKRIVKCWTVLGATLLFLGAGIVNDIQTTVDGDNRAMLQVSGDNLLAELGNRIVRDETFEDIEYIHPARVALATNTASLPSTYDRLPGDTTTWETYTASSLTPLYIFNPDKWDRINFVIHDPQTNGGTVKYYYTARGEATGTDDDWIEFTPKTNTTAAGVSECFGQSGYIDWDLEDLTGWELLDEGAAYGPDTFLYGIKIVPPVAGFTTFTIADVAIRLKMPTDDAVGRIMAYAPTGWSLDAGNGYTATQPRPLSGVELILNGGFETYTDDTPSDAFTSWSIIIVGSATAQRSATAHDGSSAITLTTVGAVGGNTDIATLYQTVDVEPATEYTLSFWTQGDGIAGHYGQWRLSSYDLTGVYSQNLTNSADTMVSDATWTRITKTFITSPYVTHVTIHFLSPIVGGGAYAMFDDVSLQAGGGKAVRLESQGETVLENLIRIADTTGEHFLLSPAGRQVLWLGQDMRDSGMRAIANVDPVAVATEDDVCLIQALTEVAAGADLYSRVYPYGGGSEPIPTLRNTTRFAPDGYTLDKTNNYLARNQSEAAYGQIEYRLDAPDVTNISGDPSGDIHSCNMLFDRALVWLMRHSATTLTLDSGDMPRTYDLQLLKCQRVLLPGYTIRVEYDRYAATTRTMHVNGDMWILSSTLRADANGVQTVALQCATVDFAAATDADLLADVIRKQRTLTRHV